jgi:tocopherol cyclase
MNCSLPHSGYHWNKSIGSLLQTDRFFEGWYFRVTLPQQRETFAFMYSIEDPIGGKPHSGGAAQILGPGETYFCRTLPRLGGFWAWSHDLGLGHWHRMKPEQAIANPQLLQHSLPRYLDPQIFDEQILEGYQVTTTHHQGKLRDPGSGHWVQWQYTVRPLYGWGGSMEKPQQATGGGLSYLPIFEPGWQVLLAHGFATGWIEWQNQRYEFEQAPTYAEKNWGGAFPQKWFWLNCNCFTNHPDLTVTAAAGRRKVLWWTESVGLIGIHYQNQFYEFTSWNAQITWEVKPWGYWYMRGQNEQYEVELWGTTDREGAIVRVPSAAGLIFDCRDTTQGHLTLTLRERNSPAQILVQADSDLGAFETGGAPWPDTWRS